MGSQPWKPKGFRILFGMYFDLNTVIYLSNLKLFKPKWSAKRALQSRRRKSILKPLCFCGWLPIEVFNYIPEILKLSVVLWLIIVLWNTSHTSEFSFRWAFIWYKTHFHIYWDLICTPLAKGYAQPCICRSTD